MLACSEERDRQAMQRIPRKSWKYLLKGWVAVKELNLSYYIGGTILITICTHYGNLNLSSLTATQKEADSFVGNHSNLSHLSAGSFFCGALFRRHAEDCGDLACELKDLKNAAHFYEMAPLSPISN